MKRVINNGLILLTFLTIIFSTLLYLIRLNIIGSINTIIVIWLSTGLSFTAMILSYIIYPRVYNPKLSIVTASISVASIILLYESYYASQYSSPNVILYFLLLYNAIIILITAYLPQLINIRSNKIIIIISILLEISLSMLIFFNVFDPLILNIFTDHAILLLIAFILFVITLIPSLLKESNSFHTGGILSSLSLLILLSFINTAVFSVPSWESYIFIAMPSSLIIGISVNWISRISHMAFYDPLLRIYNRSYANKIINGEIQIDAGNMAIIMIDIDHFKKINDRYGHPFGDKILINTSKILSHALIPDGILCRYGGEEFIVFMKYSNKKALRAKLDSILKRIEKSRVKYGKKSVSVTVSAGICTVTDNSIDITERINTADRALYRSKENGRNRITVK